MSFGFGLGFPKARQLAGGPSLNFQFAGSTTLDPLITFSRPSGATWFNSAGVLQGVDFSVTSNTIGTGSKTFTLDATAGANRYWAVGDTVLISDQSNSSNNMTGTVTSYTASTQVLVVNVTSTGGSGTIASWRIGSTMPRLDYNPATLAARGLLIEEARTNLLLQSETLQTTWSPGASSVSANVTVAPSGTTTADKLVEDGTTATHVLQQFLTFANATAYTLTGYFKAAERSWCWMFLPSSAFTALSGAYFNLGAGTVGSTISTGVTATIEPVGNGWYRCAITKTSTAAASGNTGFGIATGNNVNNYTGDGTSGIFAWGLQLEAGAFPTSYIPTTVIAATRSADVASVNTLSPWFNATEGTIYANVAVDYTMPASLFPALASLNDNTSGNRIELGFVTSSVASFEISVGGSIVTSRYPSTAALNRRVAGAYKASDSAISVNNAAAVATTPTSASLPTVTKLDIGARASGSRFTGWIRRVTYYPRRLSNAELQAITA